MELVIQKILEYSDLFSNKNEFDPSNVLRKYSRESIIRVAVILTHNYSNAYIPDSESTFFSAISASHINELYSLLSSYLKRTQHEKVCYCTTKTSLELLRLAYSIPIGDYSNTGKLEDFEYDLFKVVLFLNERMMAFSKDQDASLPAVVYLLNYSMNDMIEQDDNNSIYTTQLLYAIKLKEFLEDNDKIALTRDKWLQSIGIDSYVDYARTIYGLLALDMDFTKNHPKGCPFLDLDVSVDKNNLLSVAVIKYLAIQWDEVISMDSAVGDRNNNIDYRVFRSHPLIKLSDGHYVIFNRQILAECLYNNMFFELKKFYKGDFFEFYNKHFVEEYLFQPIMRECLKGNEYFYPVKTGPEEEHQPDFYIRKGGDILLFECKGVKINGNIKEKADLNELIEALKQKFVLSTKNHGKPSKENSEGITQLADVIDLIEDDNPKWDADIPDDVTYYPFLVIEDPKITCFGFMPLVNSWFDEYRDNKLEGTATMPVITTSIKTFYLFKDAFNKRGLLKYAGDYANAVRQNSKTHSLPIGSFEDYMKKHAKKNAFNIPLLLNTLFGINE